MNDYIAQYTGQIEGTECAGRLISMSRTSCHLKRFPCFFKICAEEGKVSCEFGSEGPLLESTRLRCTWSEDWDPSELALGIVYRSANNASGKTIEEEKKKGHLIPEKNISQM